MEKSRQTFEQSKCKMQRLNFFVVQQSLEWNTVMQIGKGATIMGERYGLDTAWLGTSSALCQSFDSQSSFTTFLSLFIYSFQGNQGRKTVGKNSGFLKSTSLDLFCYL